MVDPGIKYAEPSIGRVVTSLARIELAEGPGKPVRREDGHRSSRPGNRKDQDEVRREGAGSHQGAPGLSEGRTKATARLITEATSKAGSGDRFMVTAIVRPAAGQETAMVPQ